MDILLPGGLRTIRTVDSSPFLLPRLPKANPGGLDPDLRTEISRWCESDQIIADLRRDGVWTDLHDRAATYAPFLRSQEHSAQIERPVLADYEKLFKDGQINLLNCSTTMEMGIDIPNVQLVANGNTPPSISNYRQRLGRSGRRGEPWAFGMTFCRDLPLDRIVFENPERFLKTSASAPAVRLDSPGLVARHVSAAMLGAFLRDLPEGFSPRSSTGAFFGATDDADEPFGEGAVADDFLRDLRGTWACSESRRSDLANLTKGTALESKDAEYLTAETAETFERLLRRWREEYAELLLRRDAASEPEVRRAFAMRERRMKGEFLLAELARRGFTPSYGFPVDVVTFDHLSGHNRELDAQTVAFGERRGGASRTLDIAIREYAPGAEIVVDGLVHRSEGVLPAWKAMADASKLEDLQYFWECSSCSNFGLSRMAPETCPECQRQNPAWKRSLRPAGFLGRRAPHTGYENLGHAPYELPKPSASKGTWRALPDSSSGRYRADSEGQVVTLGSGSHAKGYALCLDCGRAEAETEEGTSTHIPNAISRHIPLASAKGVSLKGKYCPGGFVKRERIQRNVRFIHATQTDVFELQLPKGTRREVALALAAGLREALAEWLGTETREIGISAGASKGPTGESRISAFLYDRASGGAGFSSRLVEFEWLETCLKRAGERLSCAEDCTQGCPTCVLRPDLNFGDERINRRGGMNLARKLNACLEIPERLRVFGPTTLLLNCTLSDWLEQRSRSTRLDFVTLYLHGAPADWELGAWPVNGLLGRLNEAGVKLEIVMCKEALTNKGLTLGQRLDLHRLSANISLGLTPDLPISNGAAVVAVMRDTSNPIAIAAPTMHEAIPGPHWGLGEEAPLVRGPAAGSPEKSCFSAEQLVKLSGGNACLVRVGAKLDGPVSSFGRAFWKLVEDADPTLMAALRKHGARKVTYSDRYLLTPLSLRLFSEVFHRIPGAKTEQLIVATARISQRGSPGWAVFHTFVEDRLRRAVMLGLLPGARIDLRDKMQLPHERSLELILSHGRRITVLFDQGFGAWRTRGAPRFDFVADPPRQARSLKSLRFAVEAETGRDVPVVLQMDEE